MILEQINLPQTHSSVRDGFNSSLALVFIFRLLISLYHCVEGKHKIRWKTTHQDSSLRSVTLEFNFRFLDKR